MDHLLKQRVTLLDIAADAGVSRATVSGAGDMYGIQGIDHLAHPGLLRRCVAAKV